MIKPVGMLKLFTAIAISGVFTVLSYGLKGIVDSVSSLGASSLVGIAMLPIVMVALSFSIMLSSYLLASVKPVGLFQLFTAIAIAGVFTVISYGLANLMDGLSKIKLTSLVYLPFLPLILVAVSLSIALSSYALSMVKPVGLFQLITAIFIAGAFAVISYGIGKLVEGLGSLKNPAQAALVAATLPILLVAISYAIMLSSIPLSQVKPIGLFQFFTSVMISLIFIPISFALPFISKAIENISVAKIVILPIILVAMAGAIYLTSLIFAEVKPIALGKLFNIVMQTLTLSAIGLSMGFTLKYLGEIKTTTILKGALNLVLIAATIAATSLILGTGDYTNPIPLSWTLGTAAAMIPFGVAAVLLGNIAGTGVGAVALAAGLVSILAVAATIVATSFILAKGNYSMFPPIEWSKSVGMSLLVFGTGMAALGGIIVASFGVGALALAAGSAAVLGVAETIVESSFILSKGNYGKGPTKDWAEGVSLAIGAFSKVYQMIASNGIFSLFGGGLSAEDLSKGIVTISNGIVTSAQTFASAKTAYISGPPKAWAEGVSEALKGFTGIFQALNANSGWFTGGLNPEDYGKAIESTGKGLVQAAKLLQGEGVVYDINKVPGKEWGEKITGAFMAFIPVLKYLSEQSGFFSDGAEDTQRSMESVANSIKSTSLTLAEGKYTMIIDQKWSMGLKSTMNEFVNTLNILNESDVDEDSYTTITDLSNVIVRVSKLLSKGIYNTVIPKPWMESIKFNMLTFVNLFKQVENLDLEDDFSEKVLSLASGIVNVADFFGKSKVPFDMKKIPSLQWSQSLNQALTSFGPGLQFIQQNEGILTSGEEKLQSGMVAIVTGLTRSSQILARGRFDKPISPNWIQSLGQNILQYIQLTKTLEKEDVDSDVVEDFADGMVKLAEAYEKFGESLSKFNTELSAMDVERLTAVKNLSGSLVMLSLMDPGQFDSMMNSLESKAKIFVDVMKDVEKSAPEEKAKASATTAVNRPGAKVAPTTPVKQVTPVVSKQDQMIDNLQKTMAGLQGSLNVIAGVIAGGGNSISLKTYIESKMKDKKSSLAD